MKNSFPSHLLPSFYNIIRKKLSPRWKTMNCEWIHCGFTQFLLLFCFVFSPAFSHELVLNPTFLHGSQGFIVCSNRFFIMRFSIESCWKVIVKSCCCFYVRLLSSMTRSGRDSWVVAGVCGASPSSISEGASLWIICTPTCNVLGFSLFIAIVGFMCMDLMLGGLRMTWLDFFLRFLSFPSSGFIQFLWDKSLLGFWFGVCTFCYNCCFL